MIPTNFEYCVKLGSDAKYSGLLFGLTYLSSLVSNIIFTYLDKKSFKLPLILSTILFIIGNILYILAENAESIIPVIFSRMLIGLGGSRAINRQYIKNYIPYVMASKYFMLYVLYSSLGFALGKTFFLMFIIHLNSNPIIIL